MPRSKHENRRIVKAQLSRILELWTQRGKTSLAVQGLRLHAPNSEGWVSNPGQGTRSHMPQLKTPQATVKVEDPVCCH